MNTDLNTNQITIPSEYLGNSSDQMFMDLEKCIFDTKNALPVKNPNSDLRYKIGDYVECLVDEWELGTVTKTWFREENWKKDKYVPYQVVLDTEELITIIEDSNTFIRDHKNKKKFIDSEMELNKFI